jgi:chromosome segregation ATPase
LIIFAGFVVYLIWGLVFDFTIEAHEKLDKVRLAIRHKEDEIRVVETNIDRLNAEINTLEEKEHKNIGEINKLNELIDHTTIIPKEFEQYLFHFMQGWLHWMSANLKNQTQQQECEGIMTVFISTNINQLEPTNS